MDPTIPNFDEVLPQNNIVEVPREVPTPDIPNFDEQLFDGQTGVIQETPNFDTMSPISSTNLTVEEVIQDEERMSKIRNMMSKSKDVYYETAPAEETMKDFMAHMRFLNTNEASTAMELMNITAADEETRAVYGEAYRVYDEMGSLFSNGDAWNGVIDYGQSVLTSPSLYLGLGIGKLASSLGTKAASKAVVTTAINTAAKQVAQKSGGKVAESLVKQQLRNTASKVSARYAVAGAVGFEAPVQTLSDYMYQEARMKSGVQDEYDLLQGALATLGGAVGGVVPATVLLRSSKSPFADAPALLNQSFAKRAKTASKRAAPEVKKSLEKAQIDWLKLAEAGKGLERNDALEKAVANWFLNINDENSLVRILQKEGADLTRGKGEFSESLIAYAMNMGDDALKEFDEVLKPLNMTFGRATEVMAAFMRGRGQDFNLASQASRFYEQMQGVSVAKATADRAVANGLEEAADAAVDEKQILSYVQSTWKKMLVSTLSTIAVNVKGWAIARGARSMSDVMLAGGLLGKAGIRAVVNPAGAMKDLMRVKALAENQAFALNTLVDPFLSAEGFLALLERAPTKVKKSVSGQIFGGVDDFSPSRYGLDPSGKAVKTTEAIGNVAQKISFVHLQDTLTKGISGLTALDKESRLAFNKGIKQLLEDGETWKLTDEMWERSMKAVLEETFSEDLSKGKGGLTAIAKVIQSISADKFGGFIVPFGKFINNTMAFTYRYSPLGTVSVGSRAFKNWKLGKPIVDETMEEMMAKVATGSVALHYLTKQEAEKQEEGLQWFERRRADGSIENVSTLFPYSVYALLGRIKMNYDRGEGMSLEMLEELKKQVGPLDAIEGLATPDWLNSVLRFLADPQIENEEKSAFWGMIGFVGEAVGGVAAGFTRPLDLVSRGTSYVNPEAGGGIMVDRKQAEGMDKFVLGLTRYVSGFFNLAFGTENEYGVRMYGDPKESASVRGPVKMPNPVSTGIGSATLPTNYINKMLAAVDKPPYLADSFTSGVPEYDAFANKEITPLLESRAKALLANPIFKNAPQSAKIKLVNNLLTQTETELMSLLDDRQIGGTDEKVLKERQKLMTMDRAARRRAMQALGITAPEHKLSLYQIESIRRYMSYEEDELGKAIK